MNALLENSTVLITGGTGTFGTAFLEKCIDAKCKDIRIFSRDEKKQYDMQQKYRTNKNVRYYIGDVRDYASLIPAVTGVDYIFHAAAMKQVPSCEEYPMEAVKTNVIGSRNVVTAAIECGVKRAVFLSTDKAVLPTSAMGLSKSIMEKLVLSRTGNGVTKLCITRFGNIIASRGSVVPLFLDSIRENKPITVTNPKMTRFIMTIDDAVELVLQALLNGDDGDIYVKQAKSCTVGDLATAAIRYLNAPSDYPIDYVGSRSGEKLHEALLTESEASCSVNKGGYIIVKRNGMTRTSFPQKYKSETADMLTVDELVELIDYVMGREEE